MDDQNKNLILATALSFLVILVWFILFPPPTPDQAALEPQTEQIDPATGLTPPATDTGTAAAPGTLIAPGATREAAVSATQRVALEPPRLSGSVSLTGGRIDYLNLTDYRETIDPDAYIGSVKGYYTSTEGDMLSLPFNSSTPVLWVNRDAFEAAGVDPDMDLSTRENVGGALDALKAGGEDCPLVTAWQSWIHLENFSAYHDVPFASKDNGFAGLDTELKLNGPAQVAQLSAMQDWAKDGKFIYTGRRNEGGANFRSGECALFTESSAGYAGIKAEAEFGFDVRPLPYWKAVADEPQNTIIGGASLWVMEGHDDAEYKGVGEFLAFLSKANVQASWHQNTGYLPITLEAGALTKSQGFYDKNPGTDIAVIQMTAKQPTANSKGLRLGSFDQIRGIIDEELEAIWSGDKTAQEAMDSAKERGDALLRRFESANR